MYRITFFTVHGFSLSWFKWDLTFFSACSACGLEEFARRSVSHISVTVGHGIPSVTSNIDRLCIRSFVFWDAYVCIIP